MPEPEMKLWCFKCGYAHESTWWELVDNGIRTRLCYACASSFLKKDEENTRSKPEGIEVYTDDDAAFPEWRPKETWASQIKLTRKGWVRDIENA